MACSLPAFLGILIIGLSGAAVAGSLEMPSTATEEALQALDTDRSGKVEKAEIEAFARSQGLSVAEVESEFKDLDANGNGELEADEIQSTLAEPEIAEVSSVAKAADALKAAKAAASMASVAGGGGGAGALGAAKGEVGVSLEGVPMQAEQNAGKVLAEVFARTAGKVLEVRSQDVQKAAKLEAAAKSLRGQTAELQRSAAQLTVRAARDAANAVLRSNSEKVHELEAEAAQAEREAVERHAQAQAAMQRALEAQAEMTASVQRLNQGAVSMA